MSRRKPRVEIKHARNGCIYVAVEAVEAVEAGKADRWHLFEIKGSDSTDIGDELMMAHVRRTIRARTHPIKPGDVWRKEGVRDVEILLPPEPVTNAWHMHDVVRVAGLTKDGGPVGGSELITVRHLRAFYVPLKSKIR